MILGLSLIDASDATIAMGRRGVSGRYGEFSRQVRLQNTGQKLPALTTGDAVLTEAFI